MPSPGLSQASLSQTTPSSGAGVHFRASLLIPPRNAPLYFVNLLTI